MTAEEMTWNGVTHDPRHFKTLRLKELVPKMTEEQVGQVEDYLLDTKDGSKHLLVLKTYRAEYDWETMRDGFLAQGIQGVMLIVRPEEEIRMFRVEGEATALREERKACADIAQEEAHKHELTLNSCDP